MICPRKIASLCHRRTKAGPRCHYLVDTKFCFACLSSLLFCLSRFGLAFLSSIISPCRCLHYGGLRVCPLLQVNQRKSPRQQQPQLALTRIGPKPMCSSRIIAIATTYTLQPRGSHVFLEGGRMWKLSPLLTFLETKLDMALDP